MKRSENDMHAINYEPARPERHSLKQKLVAAVANGDEEAADELRLLLKLNGRDRLPANRKLS